MAQKLISAARQRYSRLVGWRSAATPVSNTTNQSHLIRRRSGLELTGAFLFTALLIAGGATLHADNTTTNAANNDPNAPANGSTVQLTQTSSNTGSNGSDSSSNAGANSSNTTQTTQVTSNSTNGNSSTKVTVDGKPVKVPANGTTTINNGDGSTTTVTTDTNGNAVNSVNNQTDLNVSNDINFSDQEVPN